MVIKSSSEERKEGWFKPLAVVSQHVSPSHQGIERKHAGSVREKRNWKEMREEEERRHDDDDDKEKKDME